MVWFYTNSAVRRLVPYTGVSALELWWAELIPRQLPGAGSGRGTMFTRPYQPRAADLRETYWSFSILTFFLCQNWLEVWLKLSYGFRSCWVEKVS